MRLDEDGMFGSETRSPGFQTDSAVDPPEPAESRGPLCPASCNRIALSMLARSLVGHGITC